MDLRSRRYGRRSSALRSIFHVGRFPCISRSGFAANSVAILSILTPPAGARSAPVQPLPSATATVPSKIGSVGGPLDPSLKDGTRDGNDRNCWWIDSAGKILKRGLGVGLG
jgi:hypothetical protein